MSAARATAAMRPLSRVFASHAAAGQQPLQSYLNTTQPVGMLSVQQLKHFVSLDRDDPEALTMALPATTTTSKAIRNVTVGFTNMYGGLFGKRFDADFFLSSCLEDGTHACDYLLASGMKTVAA